MKKEKEEHHNFEGLLLLLCSYFSTFTFGWTARVNFSHAPAAFQTFSSLLLFCVARTRTNVLSTQLPLCVSWYSLRQSLTFFWSTRMRCFLLVPKKFRRRSVEKHCSILLFLRDHKLYSSQVSYIFVRWNLILSHLKVSVQLVEKLVQFKSFFLIFDYF